MNNKHLFAGMSDEDKALAKEYRHILRITEKERTGTDSMYARELLSRKGQKGNKLTPQMKKDRDALQQVMVVVKCLNQHAESEQQRIFLMSNPKELAKWYLAHQRTK